MRLPFSATGSAIGGAAGYYFGGFPGAMVGSKLLGGIGKSYDDQERYYDNLAYQTYMSNTAYQRAMADMKAAGLNPMLAYMLGGASTPSAPGGEISDASAGVAASVSSAVQHQKMNSEIDQIQASAKLQNEQALTQNEQRELLRSQKIQADMMAAQSASAAALNRVREVHESLGLSEARQKEKVSSGPAGDIFAIGDRLMNLIPGIRIRGGNTYHYSKD